MFDIERIVFVDGHIIAKETPVTPVTLITGPAFAPDIGLFAIDALDLLLVLALVLTLTLARFDYFAFAH